MEKFTLDNRRGMKIVGNLYVPENHTGLAFILHGLGGFKDQVQIKAASEIFYNNGYTVVAFDATNSIGESGGKYEDATMRFHNEDLEDVIEWSKKQPWFKEPFILAGHSLGGYAAGWYAENHPKEVKGVFLFSSAISGELSFETHYRFKAEEINGWKETGWTTRTSNSKPGTTMKLPWSHMEERLKHDLRPKASNLTMPVLFVVGEKDESCPPDHQRILFNLVPGPKELHIIPGASHSFNHNTDHLNQVEKILDDWLKKI